MQAQVKMRLDTTWSNAVEVELTVELDNPHEITAGELFALMIARLRLFSHEIRAENERAALGDGGANEGAMGRERAAVEALHKERGSGPA